MKKIPLIVLLLAALACNCNNMLPDSTQVLKAYPNPYNPTAGVLTIENADGSQFSTVQNDFIVYDFALNEIYRANLLPTDTTNKKLIWAGIDYAAVKVSPGIYYLKVVTTTNAGARNADNMFKLIVQ
jgi:hypothetical protein